MATGALGPWSRKTSRAAALISRSLTCLRRPIGRNDSLKQLVGGARWFAGSAGRELEGSSGAAVGAEVSGFRRLRRGRTDARNSPRPQAGCGRVRGFEIEI